MNPTIALPIKNHTKYHSCDYRKANCMTRKEEPVIAVSPNGIEFFSITSRFDRCAR